MGTARSKIEAGLKMISFRSRLTLLIIGIVWAVQLSTFLSVYSSTDDNVRQKINNDLQTAGHVYRNIIESKNNQLINSAEVLTTDIHFKEAIASKNKATIHSAIVDHANRINADLINVISLEGELLASSSQTLIENIDYYKIVDENSQQIYMLEMMVINGQLYQGVFVHVLAPNPAAVVYIGFDITNADAKEFRSLIGSDISFLVKENDKTRFYASTLPISIQQALQNKLSSIQLDSNIQKDISIDNNVYLTRILNLESSKKELAVLIQQSLNEELQPYIPLKRDLIMLSMLGSLLAVFLSIYFGRTVTRPVRQLTDAARSISDGDYESKIEMERQDEFGTLANTFNHMQAGIAEREQRIIRHAHYDEMTGLANRFLMTERISSIISRCNRNGEQFSLLLISLSGFRNINDSFGHKIGDSVLREVSRRIERRVRASDSVARIGGDEFLVLLDGASGEKSLKASRAILDYLKDVIELESASICINFHAGIVHYPEHGNEAVELMRRADIASNDAKLNFSDVSIYEVGKDEGHVRQISVISELRQAVANNEFSVYYQPKTDARNGKVIGAEALIRWIHPTLGFMPPDEFIPVAEQSGNISLITNWMLKTVLGQCREWNEQGRELKISINLSAVDLLNPELPEIVSRLLRENKIEPSMIVLEVTESAVVRDTNLAMQLLNQLKGIGVSLSIDDYGTGFSSLAKLKQLPVNELKIDKSFVLNLREKSDDAVIVQSTIDLGHNMGLKITAEGVENEEGQRILQEYGCDLLQGYFICKPLPVEEFDEWLANYDMPDTKSVANVSLIVNHS